MNCEHISGLIPAYALDALDVEERMLVDAHVAHCPACLAELDAFGPVAASLAFVAEPREPGPELRDRVISRIGTEPIEFVAAREQRIARRHQRGRIPVSGRVLAAAAAFAGLVIWNVVLQVQVMQQRDHLARQAELVTVLALAEEPGISLKGTQAAPLASGRLIQDPSGHGAAFIVQGMPPPPPGQVYQLWFIRADGRRDSGGLFTVDDGRAVMYAHPPADVSEYVAVGVTDEPAGGSPGPTGTKVLGGQL